MKGGKRSAHRRRLGIGGEGLMHQLSSTNALAPAAWARVTPAWSAGLSAALTALEELEAERCQLAQLGAWVGPGRSDGHDDDDDEDRDPDDLARAAAMAFCACLEDVLAWTRTDRPERTRRRRQQSDADEDDGDDGISGDDLPALTEVIIASLHEHGQIRQADRLARRCAAWRSATGFEGDGTHSSAAACLMADITALARRDR